MLRVARWGRFHPACVQMTFGDRLPQIAAPYSRRTGRVVDLVDDRKMVPRGGFEPPTLQFSVACSTN